MPDLVAPKAITRPPWRDRFLTWFCQRKLRGFISLYNALKPLRAQRPLHVTTHYGSQFLLQPSDRVDSHVIDEGFYESEVLEAVRPYLGPDRVLWVIGANFGLHAVTAKYLHPETRVLAFEPSPLMAARILDQARLNQISIELHAYALSDDATVLPFHLNTSGNPGMSTLFPEQTFSYDLTLHVATQPASLLIETKRAPAPNAIILDAEGAETVILRGFGRHLASSTLKIVIFETSNDFLETQTSSELYQLLHHAGFKLFVLKRREHTAHALSNFAAVRN